MMNQVVGNITNGITFALYNINLLKNIFLEQNSIDKYNDCNELRIAFKEFYKEVLEQISNLYNTREAGVSYVFDKYQKIKSDVNLLSNLENKTVTENIIYSITQIKESFDFLITRQIKMSFNTKEVSMIKNQIARFEHDIIY
jgi:hypothetical protein